MTCVVANRRPCENIDAAAILIVLVAEEVVLVSHNAEDGQVFQTLQYLWTQLRVARHFGIHAVVGLCPAADLRVQSPFRRIARRLVGLVEHIVQEKVGRRPRRRLPPS